MLKEEYAEYCGECRYHGIQPLTFTRWINEEYGEPDPKAAAQDRYADLYDLHVLDLY